MKNQWEGTIRWLLDGESWIRFNVLRCFYQKEMDDPLVSAAYQSMLLDPNVIDVLTGIQNWESALLKRHNDAAHPIHKLSFLAEIGILPSEPAIQSSIDKILSHQSKEGPFQVLSNFPTHFGGSGKDDWLWVLCDAPLIIFCLAKFGLADDPRVIQAFEHVSALKRENGWPCASCQELGSFRGPGKKGDPCPYANLLMLKARTTFDKANNDKDFQTGINTLLDLWENSRDLRPYLFKMGTDFRKLKVPFVWYDILHVLDVLSQFEETHTDPRFQEMIKTVLAETDDGNRFQSESIWTKWKGWEFCQKREASRWVTFIVLRILKRSGMARFTLPRV